MTFLLLGCSQPPLIPPPPNTGPESEALQFFQGLYEPVRPSEEPAEALRLMDRLAHYGVPGVQIAVIDQGELRWSKAWGQAEGTLEDGRAMEPTTLLQTGSISKLIAGTATLRSLAPGEIDDEITDDFGPGLTPRALLSHTAGLGVPGFKGYERGAPSPTPHQILTGSPPASSPAIRQEIDAGEEWRYSGGGYEVLGAWLESRSGQDYAALVREQIFDPLEMTSSRFDEPAVDQAAVGHTRVGEALENGWRHYPERAAAGLWSTAEDLSAWVIDMQKAQAGKPRRRLDRATALDMMTPQEPGGWGLGPQVGGEGHASYFAHLGGNEGYRGLVLGFKSSGHGAVILTNGNGGTPLIREIVAGLATIYDWPTFKPEARDVVPHQLEELESLVGRYGISSLPGLELSLSLQEDDLILEAFGDTSPLLAASDGSFFDRTYGYEVRVSHRGEDGAATEIELRSFPSFRFTASRLTE